jgi:hypothetical protein
LGGSGVKGPSSKAKRMSLKLPIQARRKIVRMPMEGVENEGEEYEEAEDGEKREKPHHSHLDSSN